MPTHNWIQQSNQLGFLNLKGLPHLEGAWVFNCAWPILSTLR